jgi:hypothetical protein
MQLQEQGTTLMLLSDCTTRWNSTFKKLERIYNLKKSILHYCESEKEDLLREADFQDIENYIKLLSPFNYATDEIIGNDKTCSIILPTVNCLKFSLQKFNFDSEFFKKLHTTLMTKLDLRFEQYYTNKSILICTILHPNFKLKKLIKNSFLEEAVSQIRKEVKLNLQLKKNNEKSEKSQIFVAKKRKMTEFQKAIMDIYDEDEQNDEEIEDELDKYLKSKDTGDDLYIFWKNNKIEYPNLFEVARKYHSIIPASVFDEHVWSQCSYVMTDERNKIAPEKAAQTIFVKVNLPTVDGRFR